MDKIHQQHPKLVKDPYWNQVAPNSLPFTKASQNYMQEYPFPSTLNVKVEKTDQDILLSEDEETTQVIKFILRE